MANESIKIFQKGAFQLEAGKAGGGISPGWGLTGSAMPLGTDDAFPWLSFGKKKNVSYETDNSIDTEAYKDTPRKTLEYVEESISRQARFSGYNSQNFWMFGTENIILKVCVFVLNVPTIEPVAGAVYTNLVKNYVFLRKEVNRDIIYYVFQSSDGLSIPGTGTGTLTKTTGVGDATLTFSSHSVLMYEHLYELDARSRHFINYLVPEQIPGYGVGDKKNRMATLGIKMGPNDFRYKNAMCKGFSFKSGAGKFAEVGMNFCGYGQERGNYNSAFWTLPAEFTDVDSIIAHHQLGVSVGLSETTLVNLGVTALDLGVEIPLQVIQDTTTGMSIAEPVMEGKYAINCNLTQSRHSADLYQQYRDAWNTVLVRIAGSYGYLMTEFLIQEAKITESGPDDGDVAQEPLKLEVGYTTVNNWANWLYGNTLIQKSPLILRVRDLDSINHSFEI